MKKTIGILMMFFLFVGINSSMAQKEVLSADIKTDVQCGECKQRIEDGLLYVKGMKNTVVNVKEDIITVKFKSNKITLDEIRKLITELGYDADDLTAVKSAYDKLPKCCQKGGH